jgi:hypothetical protein
MALIQDISRALTQVADFIMGVVDDVVDVTDSYIDYATDAADDFYD